MLYQAMQEQYGLLFWMDELFPILFQTTQGGAFAVPQKIAVDVGHLSWDADFSRSGSSGFVGGFLNLWLSNGGFVPRIRAYPTCPTSGLEVSCGLGLANSI